jgi:hypothetical protein
MHDVRGRELQEYDIGAPDDHGHREQDNKKLLHILAFSSKRERPKLILITARPKA